MAIRRTPLMSDELKIAKKLADLVSDLRLNLDLVGIYFSEVSNNTTFRRMTEVIDSAQHEKEKQNAHRTNPEYTLF
jgi:hypothetical protein